MALFTIQDAVTKYGYKEISIVCYQDGKESSTFRLETVTASSNHTVLDDAVGID